MKRLTTIAAIALGLALTGCDNKENGGVTSEESAALNNAAEMLDASPDSLIADDQAPLGNGEVAVPEGEQQAAGNGNEAMPPE